MAKKSRGSEAQFTYDFGIAIAQSTVNKLTRLTGATVTLASAFYSLQQISKQYVETLKTNALQFGGQIQSMRAMAEAQERLMKGVTPFGVEDQLAGIDALRAVGVAAQKDFKFLSDAAKASGRDFGQFASSIANGISGNMSGLVQMGLLTERAVRMFEKYPANTIMRQDAIMNFVRQHKGLLNLIKNDFDTVQNQMMRLKETWKMFVQSIMGKPNDPGSFYGQIVSTVRQLADSFVKNGKLIRQWGFAIGQVLGFVVKSVGQFVRWTGRQVGSVLGMLWKTTDNYKNEVRAFVVWLEFWKVKIVSFFKSYGSEIKTILKLLILYKALSMAFNVTSAAILGVKALCTWWRTARALQLRYIATGAGGFRSKLASMAAFMPRGFRAFWIGTGRILNKIGGQIAFIGFKLKPVTKSLGIFLLAFAKNPAKGLVTMVKLLGRIPQLLAAGVKGGSMMMAAFGVSNPVGWILLAIAAFAILYAKFKGFRDAVKTWFNWWKENVILYVKILWEGLKLVWNVVVWIYTKFKQLFKLVGKIWDIFKDTKVGNSINKYIVKPLTKVFNFIWDVVKKIGNFFKGTLGWILDKLTKANNFMSGEIADANVGTKGAKGGTNSVQVSPPQTETSKETQDNPLLTSQDNGEGFGDMDTGVSEYNFEKGAVQIIVQKGENIDEEKLKRIITKAIEDMKRTADNRGGK